MPGATTVDRLLVAAVAMLSAAFALGAMTVLAKPALADEPAGKRDDGALEVVAKDDDDDDDDSGNSGGGGDTSNSNSRTGTTRGTGPSHSKSNTSARGGGGGDTSNSNSRTGTTRGTGPSHSRSNSS